MHHEPTLIFLGKILIVSPAKTVEVSRSKVKVIKTTSATARRFILSRDVTSGLKMLNGR